MKLWNRSVLRMSLGDGIHDGGGGGTGSTGEGGGEAAPQSAEKEKEEIRLTTKQLNERLARASRSQLKDLFGTDDVEAIRAQHARLKELQDQEEKRKREAMSEQQRLAADLEAERKAKLEAEERLAELKLQSHISEVCAGLGIKNTKFARFLVETEAGSLAEGKELDVEGFLKERLGDPQTQAAFGVSVASPKTEKAPVTTSPDPAKGAPPPPAPGAQPSGKKVSEMTPAEFQAHLNSKHGVSI